MWYNVREKIVIQGGLYMENTSIQLNVIDAWNEFTTYQISGEIEGVIEVQFDKGEFNGVILFSPDDINDDELSWEPVKDQKIYSFIKERAIKDYNGE